MLISWMRTNRLSRNSITSYVRSSHEIPTDAEPGAARDNLDTVRANLRACSGKQRWDNVEESEANAYLGAETFLHIVENKV